MFGSMTLGSALWGKAAAVFGLPMAHFIAAAGLILSVPLLRKWRLQTGAAHDLSPSAHWPAPVLAHDIEADRGPVLVTITYRIRLEDRQRFHDAITKLESERRRDGAYNWEVFQDASAEDVFVETFYVDSWLEHLRQHERVTNADRVLQEETQRLLLEPPRVTHLIAVQP
jgi:hypothetical protein